MKRAVLFFLTAALFCSVSFADPLVLPEHLEVIEDEAFRDDSSLGEVLLPEGLKRIGAYAFSGSSVTRLYLPASLENIDETAFSDCENLLCWGPAGTYGEMFCAKNHLEYEKEGGTLRALLIGETTYTKRLNGPDHDVACMQATLEGMGWNTVVQMEATKDEVCGLIDIAFSGATDKDVSLFYYSGHGVTGAGEYYSGALHTVDDEYIPTLDLAKMLASVPGKVIVILDSCGSGAAIKNSRASGNPDETGFDPIQFNNGVLHAFRTYDSGLKDGGSTRSGELKQSRFHVLTGSAYEENSQTVYSGGVWGGILTRGFASGLGSGYPGGNYSGSMPADSNLDCKICMSEIASYCREYAAAYQNVQSYSASPWYTLFSRK